VNQFRTIIVILLVLWGVPVRAADDAMLEAKVNAVFNRMSQADKAAELQGIRPNELLVDGKLSFAKCRELIPNGIGQVSQFGSSHAMPPEQLREFVRDLQHWLMTETPARVPAISSRKTSGPWAGR
jgi:beta-glucosidase